MPALLVGNAPCSWGMLEFEAVQGEPIGYSQMLDELVETGYTGTELGDWGYFPTDPDTLRAELTRRKLAMLGAFVPAALKDAAAHEASVASALKIARLLAAVATGTKPFLVLADDNGTVPERTLNAGRITSKLGLSLAEWRTFAAGANKVARAVRAETGLRTSFHHHSAGYVETPEEIAQFLQLTDPELVGLAFDCGHYAFGAGHDDVMEGLDRFRERVWYVHFKDCRRDVAEQSRAEKWNYFQTLQHGVFCELGKGSVDFPAVMRWLKVNHYDGYTLVEQDVLPGLGTPKESARRNREYLRSIEHFYA